MTNTSLTRQIEDKRWVVETLSAFHNDINGPDDMVKILNREHRRRQRAILEGLR